MGATTTALLTATCLATEDAAGAWLIEADPAGGVLAGRLDVAPQCLGGLERVAFPTERLAVTEALAATAHVHGDLRMVLGPGDPFRAFSCHQPRVPWVPALCDLPGSVVVDVGTVRAGSPVWPLLAQADVVLLVSSPEVSSAVAATEWVQAAGRVSPGDPGLLATPARIVFVDAPAGIAMTKSNLLADLGAQCAGWLPWEPATVDLVHRGAGSNDRRLRRSSLMNAVSHMVAELSANELVAR